MLRRRTTAFDSFAIAATEAPPRGNTACLQQKTARASRQETARPAYCRCLVLYITRSAPWATRHARSKNELRTALAMMRATIWLDNVRERRVGSAVSQPARSGRLTLLEGREATFTRTTLKLVALYAVTIFADRDVSRASCEHDRGGSEGKKQCLHFSLLLRLSACLTMKLSARSRCEVVHIS